VLPVPKAPSAFVKDAAQLLGGASTVERLGGLNGLDAAAVRTLLNDPDTRKDIERELALAERSGAIVQWRAREGLAVVVARIREVCDSPDTSATTLIKAGDLLARLAGLTQPPEVAPSEKFSITIVFSNAPQPATLSTQHEVVDVDVPEVPRDAA
jgi:hypothetical protein